jgi:hypothetical protein
MQKWVAFGVVGWVLFLLVSAHDFLFEPIWQGQTEIVAAINALHRQPQTPPLAQRLPGSVQPLQK